MATPTTNGQRPKYAHDTRTPEEQQSAIETAITSLRARYGDQAVNYIEAAASRKEITYDDYINTEALLSIQQTLTDYHDEFIFKVYHQQTELWFRLALHEIERGIKELISEQPNIARATQAVERVNRYFSILTESFSVLLDGLSTEEFMEFRKAFGTSSGFQSAQFRAIEILTGLERNATTNRSSESRSPREQAETHANAEDQAAFYWERAARHLTTNEPTLTLLKFKEKHLAHLNKLYESRKPYSLRMSFDALLGARESGDRDRYAGVFKGELKTLAEELLKLDDAIVGWKVSHLRAAAKHLARSPKGTGETNWAEYLAKSIAEQRCFPELQQAREQKH